MDDRFKPYLYAFTAAALFGSSAPLAKLMLDDVEPIPLAGLFYLGSGIGLLIFKLFRNRITNQERKEASLKKKDLPWLFGAILTGGILGPIVLFFGLQNSSASTASLLLNFEVVATTIIAIIFFREAVGKRIWIGIILISIASIILTLDYQGRFVVSIGLVGVLLACVFWGFDNNITRMISLKDPIDIVIFKGLFSGSFSLILALMINNPLPSLGYSALSMIIGFFCYGSSIVLFILSLRDLGSSRTVGLFGTAPFIGAGLSFLIHGDKLVITFLISVPIMIMGAFLLLFETHKHEHYHQEIVHDHRHRHDDEHHLHHHGTSDINVKGYHSHVHRHRPVKHVHEHKPDTHHRHKHQT